MLKNESAAIAWEAPQNPLLYCKTASKLYIDTYCILLSNTHTHIYINTTAVYGYIYIYTLYYVNMCMYILYAYVRVFLQKAYPLWILVSSCQVVHEFGMDTSIWRPSEEEEESWCAPAAHPCFHDVLVGRH
jgi:hypothetical protein